MADQEAVVEEATGGIPVRLIVGLLAAAGLAVFIFQNTQDVEVNFLWLDGTPPLYLLLLITAALTLILTVVVSWYLRRRRS